MTPDEANSPIGKGPSLHKPPKASSPLSGFSDPRRLRIILRLVDTSPGCSTALLLRHLREDLEWQLQDPSRLSGRLQTSGSGLERLRRELLHLGWLMAEERLHGAAESAWMLSPKGEEILRGQALSPERLALRWCVDSNRGEGIVSRLLERLWLLSPSSQGQVIFAVPSTAEPPPADLMDLSEYLLRFYQRLWVPLVQLWCPRWNQVLPEPSLDTTALAQRSEERLASHWPRFSTEAQRRAAVQQQLNAQLRTFLFGDIAPPEAVETWQRRMDWAGLSLRLSGETGGRIWFPVGVFRDKTHPAFQFIPGIASANRTYAVYAPEWSAIRASFADTLFLAYQIEQKLHSTTYVSLLVVRDQVCQQLRLGHFRFVDSLQQAFEESVAGSCPYHISLEVDRTPSELQRQARELPIEIDSAPRYIVAMQRR